MARVEVRATHHRPTVAVVDLDAIRHNVAAVRPPGAEFMAVVKANGYGHGAIPVAGAALEAGASWLGVALVEEGLALRTAGDEAAGAVGTTVIDAPILVLTEFPPGSEDEALAGGLTPTLYTEEGLERLAAASRRRGRSVGVHVKIDTGMHRVGLPPERAVPFIERVAGRALTLEGLWTHLAMSEVPGDGFTEHQLEVFKAVAGEAGRAGFHPRYLHAANSGAVLSRPQSHLDLVRVGIAMYGLAPGPGLDASHLRPAMSWRSAVSLAKRVPAGHGISYGLTYVLGRESTIATVPVGYADGYGRSLSGRASVLIRGRRYPVAGAVTMDQLMVDCGDDPVEAGDEVILIGSQGGERITAGEVAGWLGTVAYEVVCGVSERVPREYRGNP